MRPNLPFLWAASNAMSKPGCPLKWKKRLVKEDARLSLPLGDKYRQAYISPSRRASSIIAKNKAEAWQATCYSLSPKSNPKSVYSLLRSVAISFSHLLPLPTFPTVSLSGTRFRSSPISEILLFYLPAKDSALQSQRLPFQAPPSDVPEESFSSFCSPSSPAEFLAAPSNLFPSTATGPDKVAYPMLKHFSRSGMDFLLHVFNLSWSLHSFPSTRRHFLLFPSTRWEILSTLLLPSGLSLSPPACQSFLNASCYPVYSSFWSLIPFSLPAKPVSAIKGLH